MGYNPRGMALTGSQRKQLRSLAHHLDPVVQVGKLGLSEELLAAVDGALEAHELIKVRFLQFKEERRALVEEIARRCGCEVAGAVGNMAILYREHPDPEKRSIRLGGP